jgi:hypothetical protein
VNACVPPQAANGDEQRGRLAPCPISCSPSRLVHFHRLDLPFARTPHESKPYRLCRSGGACQIPAKPTNKSEADVARARHRSPPTILPRQRLTSQIRKNTSFRTDQSSDGFAEACA